MDKLPKEQKRYVDKFGNFVIVTVYNDGVVCVSAEGAIYLDSEQAKDLAEFLQKNITK